MRLNKPDGNMYEFITHTWNPIKGKCYHDCTYCYMKSINPNQPYQYLDISEFTGAFQSGQFIFIGSSTDFCSEKIPSDWILKTFDFCYNNNPCSLFDDKAKFLLQTKNPERLLEFMEHPLLSDNDMVVVCTTLETNRHLPHIMQKAPTPINRAEAMAKISKHGIKTYVTIEPIMDFDLDEFVSLIKMCDPIQVNIGKNTNERLAILPNPTIGKTVELVKELLKFTKVVLKSNSGQLSDALKQVDIELN